MKSDANGSMTVAWTDRDMMIADREMALIDPDKSEVSELMEREEPCAAPAPMTREEARLKKQAKWRAAQGLPPKSRKIVCLIPRSGNVAARKTVTRKPRHEETYEDRLDDLGLSPDY